METYWKWTGLLVSILFLTAIGSWAIFITMLVEGMG